MGKPKTDPLQDSLEKYRQKIAGSARNRAAAYELALASGRDYKPGEQVSYYITGTTKKVAAYENAKLASAFEPQNRDENIDYYIAKLDELVKKFANVTATETKQETLLLGPPHSAQKVIAPQRVRTAAPEKAADPG